MAGLQGAAGQDSCPLFDRWGNPGPLMVEPGYGGARTGAQALWLPVRCSFCSSSLLPWPVLRAFALFMVLDFHGGSERF